MIAYSDEESLRDVIATRSIIACGFASREDALGWDSCAPPSVALRRMSQATIGERAQRYQQGRSWAELRKETDSVLRRLGRFLVTSSGDVVTSAIVTFSSRNAISAAIRFALGSPI